MAVWGDVGYVLAMGGGHYFERSWVRIPEVVVFISENLFLQFFMKDFPCKWFFQECAKKMREKLEKK